MAQDQILISNLTSGQLSLAIKLGERQQIQRTIPVASSIDVASYATLDQLNKDPVIQRLLNSTPPAIAVTVVPGTEVPGYVTENEVQQRTSYPVIDQLVAGSAGLSAATPAGFTVKGRNFLFGQTQAQLVYGTGTSALTFKANRPGTNGNLIKVVLVDAASASVAVSGGALAGENTIVRTITINFRGATHANADVASGIATLVNADATAKKLIRVTAGGGGNVVALAATALAGGTGKGFKLYVGSIEQDIINTMTDINIPAQSVALTGFANTDLANLTVVANLVQSFPMQVPIVT